MTTRPPLHLISPLLLLLLHSIGGFTQKVDLDRFSFDVDYLLLPSQYVEPAQRTFGVRVSAAPTIAGVVREADMYDRLTVHGFRRVESSPTVGINLTIGDIRFERSETLTRTEDRKDKDGKVTGKTTYYSVKTHYSIRGGYKLYGPTAEEAVRQPKKRPEEAKPNRFLQAAPNRSETPEASLMANETFAETLHFTTREYASARDAARYVDQNQQSIKSDLISKYVNDGIDAVNARANALYGYTPYHAQDFLWILDSKSHPEYEVQQEAIKAVKELMKGMKANASIAPLVGNLQPLIQYFGELKTKYRGDDKRERKMRYSAYYNLAKLYLYLDQPDNATAEANGLIKNDYDTADGDRFLRQARDLKAALQKHRMATRHL